MQRIEEVEEESQSSSSANLSSIPKTEVEVFEFREVEASPAKPSREAGAQTNQAQSTLLLPANHVAPKPEVTAHQTKPAATSPVNNPTKNSNHVTCQEAELDDAAEAELERLEVLSDRSSACDCPAHIHDRESPLEIAQAGHSGAFDEIFETGTPLYSGSYSYGCLMKKWSL